MKEGGRAMDQRDIGISSSQSRPVSSVCPSAQVLEMISLNDSNCVASPGNTTSRRCKIQVSVRVDPVQDETLVEVLYPGGRYRDSTCRLGGPVT
jgi:hypothetical protein